MTAITVVKRDGTREPFDANKINLALVKASEGLPDQISKVVQVASELQLTLFDGITSEQLDEAVIQTALQNVKDDPDFEHYLDVMEADLKHQADKKTKRSAGVKKTLTKKGFK